MFDDFVERGGTTFDTAYIYGGGRGEKLLGQWIKSRGNRDEVVVIGKGAHTPHCDPESITRQLNESLERLQTDHVDLYLMHRDNEEIPVGEFVDVLDEHFRAGRIKAFGGSNWSLERFDEANAYAAAQRQAAVHAAEQPPQPRPGVRRTVGRVPARARRRVAGVAAGAAGRAVPVVEPGARILHRAGQAGGPLGRGTGPLLLLRRQLPTARPCPGTGGAHGVEPTAIALAWLLHQPYPVFPLIGPRHLSETRTSTAGAVGGAERRRSGLPHCLPTSADTELVEHINRYVTWSVGVSTLNTENHV